MKDALRENYRIWTSQERNDIYDELDIVNIIKSSKQETVKTTSSMMEK